MKDKIKSLKPIDDESSIPKVNPIQPIITNWNTCIICGIDLHKKEKKVITYNGREYTSFRFKKYYKLCDKSVCWNCVFNMVKQFKSSN